MPNASRLTLWRGPPPPAPLRAQAAQMLPCGSIGEPEDIVDDIASMCSGDGEWSNGQIVFANGAFL